MHYFEFWLGKLSKSKCKKHMEFSIGWFYMLTRPRLQLCQAPRLDKEKEWTSKKIGFRLEIEFRILKVKSAVF